MNVDDPPEKKHLYQVQLPASSAWAGAMTAALFNALGMVIELAIVKRTPGVPAKPAAISGVVALILLIVLVLKRRTPSVQWAAIAYLVTTVSVISVLMNTNLRFAVSQRNWLPFQEHKLGCLAAALVAPEFWAGLASILAYCLSGVLQLEFFFPPEVRTRVAPEPWPLLAFGLGGVLALIYRFHRAHLTQELSRIQAQNAAIRRLASVFLDIRDRMNTPLQVIELSVDVLRHSRQPTDQILDHIDRSVESLNNINSMLVEHEKEIELEAER
jgi:hypothetical protein